jgi:hypothetical protein
MALWRYEKNMAKWVKYGEGPWLSQLSQQSASVEWCQTL